MPERELEPPDGEVVVRLAAEGRPDRLELRERSGVVARIRERRAEVHLRQVIVGIDGGDHPERGDGFGVVVARKRLLGAREERGLAHERLEAPDERGVLAAP